MKLELAQQVVDRWRVGERHDGVIPRGRVGLAGATGLAAGFRLAAAWAGLIQMDEGPIGCTVGAEKLVVLAGFTAQHTGGWKQETRRAGYVRAEQAFPCLPGLG